MSLLLTSGGAALAQQRVENSLTVAVSDGKGKPLRSACVTFIPKEGEIIFRKANGKGYVTLQNVPPGNYRVVVKVDGYGADKQEVAVNDSHQQHLLLFTLSPRSQ